MTMRFMNFRPSPATVIATAALVVAGAGVGTAASGLISGSRIKPGTITGKQIKNHSVGLNKLSGSLPAAAFPTTLPHGKTIRGSFDIARLSRSP
jgi:hypothetical protein